MSNRNEGLFRHIINAFIWTAAGINAAWKHELAFRAQVLVIAVLIPIGIWIGRTVVEWALLFGSCMLILITE